MSEDYSSKDYGDYFLKLEQELARQNDFPNKAPAEEKEVAVQPAKAVSEKRKTRLNRRFIALVGGALAAILLFTSIGTALAKKPASKTPKTENSVAGKASVKGVPKTDLPNYFADFKEGVPDPGSDINSRVVLMIDLEKNEVIAARAAREKAFPASTTKIMTLLVAAESIPDMNDTFTMTYDITDPLYRAEATVAGFAAGEQVKMVDLLYGVILPSGGDAAIGLACKLCGSEAAFVEKMNAKAEQLGLKGTHFTNSTGLFDSNHYTTAEDMAVILRAAMQNDLCHAILSTYQYTTASTPQHPEGIPLSSTLFSYMYGTEPEGATIRGGKTGFVNESGYCIASFGESDEGKPFLCVTLGGTSRWPAIYDQINLYSLYAGIKK